MLFLDGASNGKFMAMKNVKICVYLCIYVIANMYFELSLLIMDGIYVVEYHPKGSLGRWTKVAQIAIFTQLKSTLKFHFKGISSMNRNR